MAGSCADDGRAFLPIPERSAGREKTLNAVHVESS
jgi:hypothetical protein